MAKENIIENVILKIPKILRKLYFIAIVGFFPGYLGTKIITSQKISISFKACIYYYSILLIIGILFMLIGSLRYIKISAKKEENRIERTKTKKTETAVKQKRNLPKYISLLFFPDQNNVFEWELFARRNFRPDDKPVKDIFIKNIKFGEGRCFKCKIKFNRYSDYRSSIIGLQHFLTGSNKECDCSNIDILERDYAKIEDQTKIKIESSLHKNFELFWKHYCKCYDEYTNGKYDEFESPLSY